MTQPTPSSVSEGPSARATLDDRQLETRAERSDTGRRALVLGYVLANLGIDFGFLGLWAVMHWAAGRYLFDRFELDGLDQSVLALLQATFSISTLLVVMTYVIRDLIISVRRLWRSDDQP